MDDEVSALHDGWSSGRLRIEGWVGETYDAYREAVGMLESDCRPISVGLVIVAGTAALESLMTDLLDEPNDIRLHNAGLRRAAGELGRRWSGASLMMHFSQDLLNGSPSGETLLHTDLPTESSLLCLVLLGSLTWRKPRRR